MSGTATKNGFISLYSRIFTAGAVGLAPAAVIIADEEVAAEMFAMPPWAL